MADWDGRFLALAEFVASWSKDPSTHTGCVLADPLRRILAIGYNGFPRGIADDQRLHDRELKLRMVVHAEINAICSSRGSLAGATAYVWPWPPCGPCAGALIQAGISEIVAPRPTPEQESRWGQDFFAMRIICAEAGVGLTELALEGHRDGVAVPVDR